MAGLNHSASQPNESGNTDGDSAASPSQMAGLNDSASQPNASGKTDGNFAATGLAQALLAAGFSGAASSLSIPLQEGVPGPAGLHPRAKTAAPQSKDENKNSLAAPVSVMTPLPTAAALPLRLHAFSREPGDREQPARAQSLSRESSGLQQPDIALQMPAAVPPVGAATQPPSETNKPALDRTAGADAAPPPNPLTPQNSPLAPTGDLAFAARVQPALAPDPAPPLSTRPSQNQTAASAQAMANMAKKTSENDAPDPAVVQPIAAGAGASLASYGHSSANPELPAPAPAAAAVPAAPSQPVEAPEPKVLEAQSKPAVPLKDISLQVAPPGAEKVEVRLVQQSGELRVAVRTGDSDLAHGLQQGLSDLVGRLQDTGFRAEAWRPGGATVQAGPVLESGSSQGAPQNRDSQSHSGGSQQQEGERRQNQPQRPGWVEELENTTNGNEKSQGANYGIGS